MTTQIILEEELKTFYDNIDSLISSSEGQYALVYKDKIISTYTSEDDAITAGYKQFGNVPFLVKKISSVEQPENFVSNNLGI